MTMPGTRRRRELVAVARRQLTDRHPATLLFAACVAITLPLITLHIGRYHWFFRDEWAFLAGRDLGSGSDIFEPHNEHWDTVGVVAFRVLYGLFGLRTYVPYQAVAVLFHLLLVVALYLLMRRSEVRPTIAAVAAGAFVLFGPGSQNIVSGFQVAFTGAVAFALVQMLLLDHDGRWGRRDGWGIASGAIALMCSGIAIPMLIGVGAFALTRRGWRVAAAHTAPLGAMYVTWYAIYAPSTSAAVFGRPSLDALWSWIWNGEVGAFVALSATPQLAIPLAAVTMCGVLLVLADRAADIPRQALLAPVVLLLVGAMNLGLIAQGRWWTGADASRLNRHVYITAALALPLVAVGLEACARRWHPLIAAVILLLVAIPGNASNFTEKPFDEAYHEKQERLVRSIPAHPAAADVPADHDPFGAAVSPHLTMGFILEAHADG